MNEGLADFLWKSEVARLPECKRELYKFITEAENSLAERAETADEFCRLLLADSPISLAVNYFQLPYEQVVEAMLEIEEHLGERIQQRSKKVKWIEFGSDPGLRTAGNKKKHLFLFIN